MFGGVATKAKKKFKQKGNLPAFYIAHKNMEKKFKYPYCQ